MFDLIKHLTQEGYEHFKHIEGRGLCGIRRFIFTTGVCYGLDMDTYEGRYCFQSYADAVSELDKWDGKEDIGGDWIKHKGRIEYCNPKLIER